MSRKQEPLISLAKVRKNFGNVTALKSIDLEIYPGVFGLIGPNGAGKTTILRIVLGLIAPDEGDVHLYGKKVSMKSIYARKKLGVLHERPSYPKSMKTSEYLELVSTLYKTNYPIEELLDLVGLSQASDRRIRDLSAGMHQRLGIAQALVGNPDLIFLDEPTANLDVEGRNEIIELIIQLNRKSGMSFVISSHILSELERVCQEVGIIKNGEIIDIGSVVKIIEKWTSEVYRVSSSHIEKLYAVLQSTKEIDDMRRSGINTITFRCNDSKKKNVLTKIQQIAKSAGIEISRVERATSLEVAYQEAMNCEQNRR